MDQIPFAKFIWLFVLAILLLNLGVGYVRAGALITSGRLTEDERRDFMRGAILASSTYCLLLTAIQIASHMRDPFCLIQFPPKTGFAFATWAVIAGALMLLLRWLWQGSGAETLARMAPALTRGSTSRTFTPRQVKIFLTAILLIAFLGNIAMQLTVTELRPVCTAVAAV